MGGWAQQDAATIGTLTAPEWQKDSPRGTF
jgi:hypothetical protein